MYLHGLIVMLVLIFAPLYADASTNNECVRKATATDVAALDYQISIGDCIDSATIAVAKPDQSAAAKAYLKTVNRVEKSKCGTASDPSIDRLNPAFAICAANFIKAYQSRYGSITITSAFRTPAQQKCVCPVPKSGTCGAPGVYDQKTGAVIGGSNHQRGIAIDIHPSNGNYAQMKMFADANPSFGVGFPLYPGDKPHMQPTNKQSPQCASPGYTIALASSDVAQSTSPNTSISDGLRTLATPFTGDASNSMFAYNTAGNTGAPAEQPMGYASQGSATTQPAAQNTVPSAHNASAPHIDVAPVVGATPDIAPIVATTSTSSSQSKQDYILGLIRDASAGEENQPTTSAARPLTSEEITTLSSEQNNLLQPVVQKGMLDTTRQDQLVGVPATATFLNDTAHDGYVDAPSSNSSLGESELFRDKLQYTFLYIAPFSSVRYGHDAHE